MELNGERGARAYNGCLGAGAEPPVGGQGAEAPLKLNAFLFCVCKGSCKFAPLLIFDY